jgi:adenine-specific DNA-methyltransferase
MTLKILEGLSSFGNHSFYGKQPTLFPGLFVEKGISLESRRYIGSKAKLTDWIIKTIKNEVPEAKSFADMFAGTASVSKAAFKNYQKVIINDTLYSNNVIYKAFFETGSWNKEKTVALIDQYNSINSNEIEDNYFSLNFGNKFFDYDSSKIIGYIREDIEERKSELTNKEYNLLLAILIYGMDKIANTVGHFDAYIKKPIKLQKLNLKLIETNDFAGIEIYREDANTLARRIKTDVAYIDPPYNSRQYNRFYHIYETLVKWDNPQLFGVALKPVPENSSIYCTVKAKTAFKDLIENLNAKCFAVSSKNAYISRSNLLALS